MFSLWHRNTNKIMYILLNRFMRGHSLKSALCRLLQAPVFWSLSINECTVTVWNKLRIVYRAETNIQGLVYGSVGVQPFSVTRRLLCYSNVTQERRSREKMEERDTQRGQRIKNQCKQTHRCAHAFGLGWFIYFCHDILNKAERIKWFFPAWRWRALTGLCRTLTSNSSSIFGMNCEVYRPTSAPDLTNAAWELITATGLQDLVDKSLPRGAEGVTATH